MRREVKDLAETPTMRQLRADLLWDMVADGEITHVVLRGSRNSYLIDRLRVEGDYIWVRHALSRVRFRIPLAEVYGFELRDWPARLNKTSADGGSGRAGDVVRTHPTAKAESAPREAQGASHPRPSACQPDPQFEREHADDLLATLDALSRKNGWGLSVRRSATGEYLVTT